MTWADGASYSGKWNMGYASEKGIFIDCLGNQYDGQFYLSMAHGYGIYTNTLGAVYEGQWRFDMQDGYGNERWLDSKSDFQGNFVNGLRNGYGVLVTDQKRYDGNWVNNMMEGQGKMEWLQEPISKT